MSSKKKSFKDKGLSLNLAEKSFILEQLNENYSRRSSMVTPADEIKYERSRSRLQTRETERDSRQSESPKLFETKKSSFRDVVLRAAQHKPFRENLDIKAQRRLSGLGHDARLHKFRQMASRWKAKSKKVADIAEVPQETEYEIVIPEKPRFCATLSTEAQYAIFKGYEDALVHKISTSLPSTKDGVSIKRATSAKAENRESAKISPFTILENKPTIALVSSLKEPGKYFLENNERAWDEEDRDRRYMTAQFEKAMHLLDEITRNSYIEQAAGAERHERGLECEVTLEKNIKQYNAWSQQWTKHFEFPC